MTATSARTADSAKNEAASSCGNRRRALQLNRQVMQTARDRFPVKTSQHLSDVTGYSVRSVEYWLSGKVVLPSDALASLLQSEWGRDFLAAVMTDNTPRWWIQLKAWISAIDYAAAERKQRRKLRELLDDANEAPGATALLLQDEDFYSGRLGPALSARRRG